MTSLDAILNQFERSYLRFQDGFPIHDDPKFFEALYNYYVESGEMPYGVQKARTKDLYGWITDRLENYGASGS